MLWCYKYSDTVTTACLHICTDLNQPHLKPVIGEPFSLTCPFKANNSAVTYSWTKYSNLDRKVGENLPSNMLLFDNGRQWKVDYYETEHNGLYICQASSSHKFQTYSHDTVFFLHAHCKLVHLQTCSVLMLCITLQLVQVLPQQYQSKLLSQYRDTPPLLHCVWPHLVWILMQCRIGTF